MPTLTDQARSAIMTISVVCVVCVVLLIIWTLSAAVGGSIVGERYPGKLLLILVGGSEDIFGRSLAGLLLIVSYGATFVAGSKLKDRLYYTIVALSGGGVLCLIALMIVMNDTATAGHVARASEALDSVEAYTRAQNVFLGALLVWLLGTLTTQLGIESAAKQKETPP